MTNATTVRVPAGWYPDPVTMTASGTATHRRWWDGVRWTTYTAPWEAPSPASSAVAEAPLLTPFGSAPTTVGASDSARIAETMPLHSSAMHAHDRSQIAAEVRAAAPYSALSPATSSTYTPATSSAPIDDEPFEHRDRAAERTSSRDWWGTRAR